MKRSSTPRQMHNPEHDAIPALRTRCAVSSLYVASMSSNWRSGCHYDSSTQLTFCDVLFLGLASCFVGSFLRTLPECAQITSQRLCRDLSAVCIKRQTKRAPFIGYGPVQGYRADTSILGTKGDQTYQCARVHRALTFFFRLIRRVWCPSAPRSPSSVSNTASQVS